MRARRLPVDIQIFYYAAPDQEPFVKVSGSGWAPWVSDRMVLLHNPLMLCDLCAAAWRGCPFPGESEVQTEIFHSTACFVPLVKWGVHPEHRALFSTFKMLYLCLSGSIFST